MPYNPVTLCGDLRKPPVPKTYAIFGFVSVPGRLCSCCTSTKAAKEAVGVRKSRARL
jgi:hypothetical protein